MSLLSSETRADLMRSYDELLAHVTEVIDESSDGQTARTRLEATLPERALGQARMLMATHISRLFDSVRDDIQEAGADARIAFNGLDLRTRMNDRFAPEVPLPDLPVDRTDAVALGASGTTAAAAFSALYHFWPVLAGWKFAAIVVATALVGGTYQGSKAAVTQVDRAKLKEVARDLVDAWRLATEKLLQESSKYFWQELRSNEALATLFPGENHS